MRRTLNSLLFVGVLIGVLGVVSGRNIAEAKTAVISRDGNGFRVSYVERNYSLQRVPGYPTTQYHFHNVRCSGTFRYFWRSQSDINRPFH